MPSNLFAITLYVPAVRHQTATTARQKNTIPANLALLRLQMPDMVSVMSDAYRFSEQPSVPHIYYPIYIYLTPVGDRACVKHGLLSLLALSSAGVFYNDRWLADLRSCPRHL